MREIKEGQEVSSGADLRDPAAIELLESKAKVPARAEASGIRGCMAAPI